MRWPTISRRTNEKRKSKLLIRFGLYADVLLKSFISCLNEFNFSICERISPRLAHANAAVVLSTVKVLMKLISILPENSDFITQLVKKLAPPMVTLLSSEPEIQYVALRNINLIVQKRYIDLLYLWSCDFHEKF